MTTRYDCALNGESLSGLDPRICVTDILESAPRLSLTTAARPGHGLHLLQAKRETLTVQIRFIVPVGDVTVRRAIVQQVNAWAAAGGVLTTCDRPGQQLHVVCQSLPAASALCWLDEMALTFCAVNPPFWEEEAPVSVEFSDDATLFLPGTAPEAPVEAAVTNEGGAALTTLTLSAGDTSMTFDGLSLPAGGVFTLTMEDGLLCARCDGEPVLLRRTDDSDDLMLLPCGEEGFVSVSADQLVTAVFSARGRYL